MKLTGDRLAVARAVANAAAEKAVEVLASFARQTVPTSLCVEDIIESLPEPPDDSPATLPAPTGPGWWFARRKNRRDWEPVLYVHDGNQEEPEAYVVCVGEEEGRDVSEFAMDAWLPLVAPTKGGAE